MRAERGSEVKDESLLYFLTQAPSLPASSVRHVRIMDRTTRPSKYSRLALSEYSQVFDVYDATGYEVKFTAGKRCKYSSAGALSTIPLRMTAAHAMST